VKIVWASRAAAALQREHAYLSFDNPVAADRVRDRILRAVESLAQFPTSGRTGRLPDTRELVITGTLYIAIYRVRAAGVTVLAVFHTSRKDPGPVN
jgi:toxin ParE1/3/4